MKIQPQIYYLGSRPWNALCTRNAIQFARRWRKEISATRSSRLCNLLKCSTQTHTRSTYSIRHIGNGLQCDGFFVLKKAIDFKSHTQYVIESWAYSNPNCDRPNWFMRAMTCGGIHRRMHPECMCVCACGHTQMWVFLFETGSWLRWFSGIHLHAWTVERQQQVQLQHGHNVYDKYLNQSNIISFRIRTTICYDDLNTCYLWLGYSTDTLCLVASTSCTKYPTYMFINIAHSRFTRCNQYCMRHFGWRSVHTVAWWLGA